MTVNTGKRALPLRPHPDHLRKEAKARLAELRTRIPSVRLVDVQFTLAREYGFESWAALIGEVKRNGQGGRPRRTLISAAFQQRYRLSSLDPDPEVEAHATFFRVGVATQVGFFLAAFAGVGLVFLTEAQMRGVQALLQRLTVLF